MKKKEAALNSSTAGTRAARMRSACEQDLRLFSLAKLASNAPQASAIAKTTADIPIRWP